MNGNESKSLSCAVKCMAKKQEKTSEMGDTTSSFNVSDSKPHLIKLVPLSLCLSLSLDIHLIYCNLICFEKVKSHEVALAELNSLPSSRPVYQKNGNIFFRTSIQKATVFEQKHLGMAKSRLEKLNAS
ncbi:hypothetical protein Ddye_026280 [Dipteronia dyeriana]|uniref:Uncharacterized protein n=1 Tax=Dipteronia dyeriana TaxID=168575 RepID=A0AAD9TN01_9ROSI|nr:hypothetical protein Ddye_026280 [Dipteronia dyeriana]